MAPPERSGDRLSTAHVSVAQLDRVSASEGYLETLANASFPLFYAVFALLSSSGKLSKIIVAGVATPGRPGHLSGDRDTNSQFSIPT